MTVMDEDFIMKAIRLAAGKSAEGTCGPFGAVVVRDGRVVGEGWNRVVETSDPTAHAEIVAIRAACRTLGTHQLNGCVLYCSCEPCPMCLSAIYWARLDTVYYACSSADAAAAGFDDSIIYTEIALPAGRRALRMTQLCRTEGSAVFRDWLSNPNRKPY